MPELPRRRIHQRIPLAGSRPDPSGLPGAIAPHSFAPRFRLSQLAVPFQHDDSLSKESITSTNLMKSNTIASTKREMNL